MNTRVKLLRNKLKLSQSEFGKKLGVTGTGISKIENSRRSLTEQMLLMICREFNVNENWLKFGEGEIFKHRLPDNIEQLAQIYLLDEMDKSIIMEYIKLNEKKRNVIKEYIMKLAGISNNPVWLKDTNASPDVLKCAEEADEEYLGQRE